MNVSEKIRECSALMDIRRELIDEIELGNCTSKKEAMNTIDALTKEIDNLIEEMQNYFDKIENNK